MAKRRGRNIPGRGMRARVRREEGPTRGKGREAQLKQRSLGQISELSLWNNREPEKKILVRCYVYVWGVQISVVLLSF